MQEPALQGDPVDRQSLEQLRPESFSSILILADDTEVWNMGSGANITDADSRCLASLLLLRDIQSSRMHFNNARMSGGAPLSNFRLGAAALGAAAIHGKYAIRIMDVGLKDGVEAI